MQTTFKIFIIIISLFIPPFIIFSCIILLFFLSGIGPDHALEVEKYDNMFITAYVTIALSHGWALYKLFRNDAVWLRVASLVIVGTAYVLAPYILSTIW